MYLVRPIIPEGYLEKRLLAAVVRRAAMDVALYRGAKSLQQRRLCMDAYRWLIDPREEYEFTDRMEGVMSFVNICRILNIDPDRLRRHALTMTKKDAVKKYEMVERNGRV